MAELGFVFDATKVPFAEPGMPIWEGPVLVAITKNEIIPTRSGDGSNMLVLHVVAGPGNQYTGQANVIRLNLWNKNPQASDIAQRQLSSIAHVTGVHQLSNADALIGRPFIADYEKQSRDVTDQQTGQTRKVESCQTNDFRFADGRTIREALGGQPASRPYGAGGNGGGAPPAPPAPAAPAAPPQAPQYAPQAPQAPQPGFAPPGAAPGPQGGFSPPGGGFAPPGAMGNGQAPGFAPPMGSPAPQAGQGGPTATAPGSFQPPQTGAGMQTAPSGFNAPGAAPQAPGFAAPGAPQPGPGPWNPNGGFAPR